MIGSATIVMHSTTGLIKQMFKQFLITDNHLQLEWTKPVEQLTTPKLETTQKQYIYIIGVISLPTREIYLSVVLWRNQKFGIDRTAWNEVHGSVELLYFLLENEMFIFALVISRNTFVKTPSTRKDEYRVVMNNRRELKAVILII